MDIVKILGAFAALLGIVGAAAFIYAYYLVSLNKAQLQGLRDDRDDLITRVKLLEEDKEKRIVMAAEKDGEIKSLNAKITILEGIVTHDASINQLIKTVEDHDIKVERKYAEYMASNQEMISLVKVLIDEKVSHASDGHRQRNES